MEKRINFLDYLRICSMLFVVMLHVSAQNWHEADVNGFDWQIFNIYNCLSRWAVPAFVMISGALFLNKKVTLIQIYKKYVLRLVIAFGVWSLFYCLVAGRSISPENILTGEYHMWFIFMIMGLYALLPISQRIVKSKKVTKCFLSIVFVFASLIPFADRVINDFIYKTEAISAFYQRIHVIHLMVGYMGYFVLGHYLTSVRLDRGKRILIYWGGVTGFLSTIVLQVMAALKTQQHLGSYYDELWVNVWVSAVAGFVWFQHLKIFQKYKPIVMRLSKLNLGVYMVHVFVLNLLRVWGINTLLFNPILSVPMIAILVYGISVGISALIHQIPIMKKYIV